jgi:menaquinone-9 beta-reductase
VTAPVVVVGGGPAGAVVASLIARRGPDVVLLERSPAYHWRACGVFSSPASVAILRDVGVEGAAIRRIARPAPAMRVETPAGTRIRLTYGDDGSLVTPAVSFDRSALDPLLVGLARDAGVDVRLGATAAAIAEGRVTVRDADGERDLAASVVVGADGIRSTVARAFGVVRPARLGRRVGMTFHVADPRPDEPRDARMVLFRGGYVGLAPVPGGRVNVGIVVDASWAAGLRVDGPDRTVERILAAIPPADDDPTPWAAVERCDSIEGAVPLGHRVASRHGSGWLLVGDAAGFLDPFTGEGLHRSLVSAALAAEAVARYLDGDGDALAGYDRAMARRFRTKDVVSLIVQAFLARPRAFEYAARRLAARDRVRETMGLVMGDLVPASRALDPRFLAAVLRP